MIKKIGLLFLALVMVVVPTSNVGAFTGNGLGTSTNPYVITTCQQLFEINNNLTGYYVLQNHVFCTGATWSHIGTLTSSAFSGTLDGQGYSINDLTVNDTNGVGLFTYINGGTVTNLRLNNFDITGTGTVGALAARADNATISLVRVSNSTVRSEYATGGLVGILNLSTVSDSSVQNSQILGRAGAGFSLVIGGFVGLSTTNTYNRNSVGGTVNALVSGASSIEQTGGFVGYTNFDEVYDSYSTANITGSQDVGGFAGANLGSTFYRSYASGSVTGVSNVGGFTGSTIRVSMLINSFAVGGVSGTTAVGGLAGHVYGIGADVTNSTWDVTRTTQTNCFGLDQGGPTTCLAGVNVAAAQPNYFYNSAVAAPLNTWNFTTVWQTTAGLPVLRTISGVPAEVRVAPTPTTVRVMWDAPGSDGGSPITSYDLKYRTSGTANYATVTGILASGAREYTLSEGIVPSTGYEIEVRARNAIGPGPWLGFIAFTTAPILPPTLPPAMLTLATTKTLSNFENVAVDQTVTTVPTTTTTMDTTTTDDAAVTTTETTDLQQPEQTSDSGSISPVLVATIIVGALIGSILLIRVFVRR